MALNLGSGSINKLYLGSTNINKAYLGSLLVYGGITPFLLDEYPNAAAAYSLRYLKSTYVGNPVVNVRRSSDNAELDFTPTEINDGTLESWVGANDGLVTTWYDQSGNNFHASNVSATQQPAIVLSGALVTQGGKASVYSSGGKNLNTGLLTLPVFGDIDIDFFAVMNQLSLVSSSHLLGLATNDIITDRRVVMGFSNDNTTTKSVRLYGGFTTYSSSDSGQLLFNTNYQGGGGAFNARINQNNLSINTINNIGLNIQESSGFLLMSGQTNNNPILTFANPTSVGYLQEAIFYLSDQSANRVNIETNINAEYLIY
jgi:hypothetical protein